MKLFFQKLLLPVIASLSFIIVHAQQPQLKIAGADSTSVSLSKMKVEVKVIGNYATTTMEMVFCNSTDRVLEGDLIFPMPDGVSISRYAIDINGKMREAVPVEKEKGQVVFENVIRRKVDPGLLEKVDGNNFKTRIYPIPANGCRTIIIGYEQLLNAANIQSFGYNLPLHFTKPLANFDFSITVASSYIPEVGTDCNTNLKFEELNKVFTAVVSKKDFMPDGAFNIAIPKTPDAVEVNMQERAGKYYFLINTFPEVKRIEKKIPDKITVIWDASLSGFNRDHKKELELLNAYIKRKGNLLINLYSVNTLFKKINSFNISGGNCDALNKALNGIIYDGATDLGAISYVPEADEYLLFTDGLNTFGNFNELIIPNHPIYPICAAAKADYSLMKYMASKSGGAFINLNELPVETALKYLTEQTLQFLGIKNNSNLSEVYPSMPTPVVDNCSISGISSIGKTSITLQFGYGSKVTFEKNIDLDISVNRTNFVNIEKIWAQKKITELDILFDQNKDAITVLGKQYGIVTRGTSLIVLDAVEDYVKYDIVPPAELLAAYDSLMKEKLESMFTQREDALSAARNYFDEVKDWWKIDFRPKPPKLVTKNKSGRRVGNGETYTVTVTNAVGASASNYSPVPPPPAISQATFTPPKVVGDNEVKADEKISTLQVGTTSNTISSADFSINSVAASPASTTTYYLSTASTGGTVAYERDERAEPRTYAWSNDSTDIYDSNGAPVGIDTREDDIQNTYLKEFKKALPANRYTTYLTLRKDNFNDPVFYFTIANVFFKERDTATGYMILSNIADLNLDDHELYKMLGYKLKTISAFKDEVKAFKKVLQLRPQDPQSYRDYGLALADAGQYQNALDTLNLAITRNYDEDIKNLYTGIEEIIVTEMNNIIAQHPGLNTISIDSSLLKKMPVDIRVVLNWNMNDTDIDLWLFDPTNEKCFYDNKLTKIGGRISNDFTRGYGPEHFMLKKAIHGKYKVKINYYGDTQQKLAGPTTVMAEIYTNYGRANQQRKMITLQMTKTDNGEVLVGEFSF